MKLKRIGKNISVFLLLGVFFYSTSVKEFHYAFSAKYHTVVEDDHCDHHIHSTKTSDDDCIICKMDVASALQTATSHYSFVLVYLTKTNISQPEKVFFTSGEQALYLRGPPQIA